MPKDNGKEKLEQALKKLEHYPGRIRVQVRFGKHLFYDLDKREMDQLVLAKDFVGSRHKSYIDLGYITFVFLFGNTFN